jgi:glycosyltransferase involved in cell wall biosynthesis
LDRQSRADLWRLYNESDVFVMPSLVEGFGLVYLEALAAGCYAIGTDNTGLPDLAPSSAEGAIVPAGDADALAMALETAYGLHARGELDPQRIRDFAAGKVWAGFRRSVANIAEAQRAA